MNATPISSIDYQNLPMAKNDPYLMDDILQKKETDLNHEFVLGNHMDYLVIGALFVIINLNFINNNLQQLIPNLTFENIDFNIIILKMVLLVGGFFIYKKFF